MSFHKHNRKLLNIKDHNNYISRVITLGAYSTKSDFLVLLSQVSTNNPQSSTAMLENNLNESRGSLRLGMANYITTRPDPGI